MSKKRLGRGLDSLLSSRSAPDPQNQPDSVAEGTVQGEAVSALEQNVLNQSPNSLEARASGSSEGVEGIKWLAVTQIKVSPFQPRRVFDEEKLEELSASIRTQGLLQPLVARPLVQGGYELIAGERRWRASQMAGLEQVPVVVRQVSDQEASALALIENIQREDLSALEEALGLARLRDEFELTQQQIADAVGKSRVAIANLLRLLNLGHTARSLLENGKLDMGHARALLSLEGVQQDTAAQEVAQKRLSVRQTEAFVKKLLAGPKTRENAAQSKDADLARLERTIMDTIGAETSIKHSPSGKGELTIRYSNLDELDGVLRRLGVQQF